MGACLASKSLQNTDMEGMELKEEDYLPLYSLKQELLAKLCFDDEHPYRIFCCWRFAKSLRRDAEFLTNI